MKDIRWYTLDTQTVKELRQYARDLGMSSATRLTSKQELIRAIRRYEEKR